ncbi:DUF4252 domain-containing protein [Robertkochia sediminum]|uniref:DUF4252 domain-containing protein n=1 Tax=Robertkochia sediminum TaxID=2785326 RepID=UPI001931FD96|nr:DUF4252 domain-containing protein [Robertkochia sediminum]MBL7473772.1 DUF4252 domain-containing protein [Robertkochia sediminum]
MKTTFYFLFSILLFSCGSAGINNFYNTHKYDPGVTAIEVPQFVLSMLKNSSPEMNDLLKNVDDIRFMNLPAGDRMYSAMLETDINRITANRYTDVYRRTDEEKNTSLFSIREKGDRVKELIWFDQGTNNNMLLYFKGDFDPAVVSKLSDSGDLDKIKEVISKQD